MFKRRLWVGLACGVCVAIVAVSVVIGVAAGRPAAVAGATKRVPFKPLVVTPVKHMLVAQQKHLDEMRERAAQIESEAARNAAIEAVEAHAANARAAMDDIAAVDEVQEELAAGDTPDASDLKQVEKAIEKVEQLIEEEQKIEQQLDENNAPESQEPSFWEKVLKVLKFVLEVILFILKVVAWVGGALGGGDGESGGDGAGASSTGAGGGYAGDGCVAIALNSGDAHSVQVEGRKLTIVPDHDLNRLRTVSLPTSLAKPDVTLTAVDCQSDGAAIVTCRKSAGDLVRLRFNASDDQPQLLIGELSN